MIFLKNKFRAVKKLKSSIKRILYSPDFLTGLCVAAFIIITIDLGSELAAQKNEIGEIIGIIEECCTVKALPDYFLNDLERPLLFNISFNKLIASESICESSAKDRAPPANYL